MDRRRDSIAIVAVFLIGLSLRLVAIGSEPLWTDEFFTALYVSGRSLIEVVTYSGYTDPHPPLYYALMWGWLEIVPTTPVMMRLPSAFFGALAAPTAYAVGKRLDGRRTALYAGILFAVAPRFVYYSQQARMYGLLLFLFTACLYTLLRYLQEPTWYSLLGVVIANVAAVYTHTYGLFVLVTSNFIILLAAYRDWDFVSGDISLVSWVGAQGATVLFILPWIGILLVKIAGGGVPSWIPEPSIISIVRTFSHWATYTNTPHGIRPALVDDTPNLLVSLPIAGIMLALFVSDATSLQELLLVWTVTPIVVSLILSYAIEPIYFSRYFVQFAIGLLLLVAIRLGRGVPDRNVGAILMAAIVVSSVPSLVTLYTVDENIPQRSVIEEIDQQPYPVVTEDVWTAAGYRFYGDGRKIPETGSAKRATVQENLPDGPFWVYNRFAGIKFAGLYNETHVEKRRINRGGLEARLYVPKNTSSVENLSGTRTAGP